MPPMNRDYITFYLDGRQDDFDCDGVGFEELAQRVLAGEPVRDIALAASKDLLRDLLIAGADKAWMKKKKNRESIAACGGDSAAAWALYSSGMVESTAIALEDEIVEEMANILDGGPSDDEDEEDDDDEDEDDDEDDDDEDDSSKKPS